MRALRTTLRTLHVLAFSAYFGGALFAVPAPRLQPALTAVLATGLLFLAFEVWRSPLWLQQLRGICTFAKLALLAAAVWLEELRVPLLAAVVVIGVLVSHAPSRFRYYAPFKGRVIESHGRG